MRPGSVVQANVDALLYCDLRLKQAELVFAESTLLRARILTLRLMGQLLEHYRSHVLTLRCEGGVPRACLGRGEREQPGPHRFARTVHEGMQ